MPDTRVIQSPNAFYSPNARVADVDREPQQEARAQGNEHGTVTSLTLGADHQRHTIRTGNGDQTKDAQENLNHQRTGFAAKLADLGWSALQLPGRLFNAVIANLLALGTATVDMLLSIFPGRRRDDVDERRDVPEKSHAPDTHADRSIPPQEAPPMQTESPPAARAPFEADSYEHETNVPLGPFNHPPPFDQSFAEVLRTDFRAGFNRADAIEPVLTASDVTSAEAEVVPDTVTSIAAAAVVAAKKTAKKIPNPVPPEIQRAYTQLATKAATEGVRVPEMNVAKRHLDTTSMTDLQNLVQRIHDETVGQKNHALVQDVKHLSAQLASRREIEKQFNELMVRATLARVVLRTHSYLAISKGELAGKELIELEGMVRNIAAVADKAQNKKIAQLARELEQRIGDERLIEGNR